MRFFRLVKSIALMGFVISGSMCGAPGPGPGPASPAAGNKTCGGSRGFDGSQAVRIGACGSGDYLISGTLVRDIGGERQYDGPLELSADSAVVVTLNGSYGDVRGDAPAELVTSQIITPVPDFPISYCLAGDAAKVMGYHQLFITAEVRQHADTYTVGDLMEEIFHEVTIPKTAETLHMTGIENCSSPNSGGFCVCE